MTTTSDLTKQTTRWEGVSLFGFVGTVLAIMLVLLTFRERVALTVLSDQVSVIRTELAELEDEQNTLTARREMAIDLDELEDYAVNVLGMVRPDARNLRWIEGDR